MLWVLALCQSNYVEYQISFERALNFAEVDSNECGDAFPTLENKNKNHLYPYFAYLRK